MTSQKKPESCVSVFPSRNGFAAVGLAATVTDLFGAPVRAPIKGTVPAGYVSRPGTGPAGETCGTCKFACRTHRYAKCRLNELRWTHGIKTDIRLRTPACDKWEAA